MQEEGDLQEMRKTGKMGKNSIMINKGGEVREAYEGRRLGRFGRC